MTATTRIAIGAHVRTSDGQDVGKVESLIIDTFTRGVKAIVVRKGFFLHHDVEIPASAVQEGTEAVLRLRYTADEVRKLPEFVDARYTPPPAGYVPPTGYGLEGLLWPVGVPLDPSPRRIPDETWARLDLENAVIDEGSDVISRDGKKIGVVHAVALDPATSRPTSIMVRRGFLFAKEVELPAHLIRAIDDGVVYLDLDEEQARASEHAPA